MEAAIIKELQITACKARISIIEGVHAAKAGHPGGSLSCVDILTYLYYKELNVDPKNPDMENRDRFVLSKGHAAPALYAVLAEKGFFDKSIIKTLRQIGSILQGHPDMKKIPGVDMSTGSLGQGISCAVGMALSSKHFGSGFNVYTVLGDGEIEEGQVWEAAMFAGNKNLSNLTAFVDYNNLQIDGTVEEVNSPAPIDKKFEAFGWHTIIIDGHDFNQIEAALKEAKTVDKPVCIIAKTVKGKGVSYMENAVNWHGAAPNDELAAQALKELNEQLKELEA
ncbi:MAG: transketolase [Clostridia bacterium]|nr:transketolase [Clostridia bacterium]